MEELKDCWCGARFRDTPTGAPGNRRRTALGKLAAHYNRFSNVGIILAFLYAVVDMEHGESWRGD